MDRFLTGGRASPLSDNIILSPEHPDFNGPTELEFKLPGEQYLREAVLARKRLGLKEPSPVWRYGEALVQQ